MSEIPEQLSYTAEHEWIADGGELTTIGITAHAVEELGDIVYVDMPSIGDTVEAGAVCGEIESTKAVSEIYAPISGEIVEVNDAAVDTPETIGVDPYGDGWLFRIKVADGSTGELLDAAGYRSLIES